MKYTHAPKFLANGLFRFTQPAALNDPYEALPKMLVNSFASEDVEVARRKATENGYSDISEEMLVTLFLRPFPAHRMDEKSFPGLWPAREPRLREAPFESLAEYDEAMAQRAVELAQKRANQTTGVLSLTESAHETMWAHYADDHHGICITFDATHPYFQSGNLKPIIYSDRAVHVTVNDGWLRFGGRTISKEALLRGELDFLPNEILWRKQLPWAYEQEWRMIMPLAHADQTVRSNDSNDLPICLFKIPSSAISGITFGLRAAPAAIEQTRSIIRDDARWRHLFLHRRIRSPTGIHEEDVGGADL